MVILFPTVPENPANNSLLMFKRQSANNEGGSSATAPDGSDEQQLQLQKQASSWQKAAVTTAQHGGQPSTQMEIAAVDSKESKSLFPPTTHCSASPLKEFSQSTLKILHLFA